MTRPPTVLWFAAIILVAANLRPVIASVPPIVDRLAAGLGLSAVGAGALTTLPVLCMGLFAPAASVLAHRLGEAAALAGAVTLIAVGAAARGFLGPAGLYGGTAVAGLGIAVAGALLPGLVRVRVPDRVGPVTGVYTASLIGGALLAAGLTEPLRAALGWSAQAVLALWSVPALVALAAWLSNARAAPPRVGPGSPAAGLPAAGSPAAGLPAAGFPAVGDGGAGRPARVGLPWRSRAAWLGTLFMGGQSLLFYATLAWLAARYTALGMTGGSAGLLLALFSAAQVVTALAMPVLAHRAGDLRPWIAISVGLTTAGLLLVALVPAASPWLWATVLGLGMGGNLSLALTVLTQSAPTPRDAAAYTGMAFFVGYLLAAVGPVAAGALIDATASYTPVFLTLSVLGVLTLFVGVASAPRPRGDHERSAMIDGRARP